VYKLGLCSWRPEASLSDTVTETDAQQTCKLSHDILQLSEVSASTDDDGNEDADQLLKPTTVPDQTSSRPLSQFSESNSESADLPSAEPTLATDDIDTSSTHAKLTWSASGGLKQTLVDDTEFE